MQPIFKKTLNLALGVFLGLTVFFSLLPLSTWAATLLNGGFNNPFNDIPGRVWQGQNEKIAGGWNYFYIDANTYPGSGNASKLRWMSSAQFAAAFNGLDYYQEGDQAQNMWSSYEFDGGVYQQVSATPGEGYIFDIDMVTYWRGPGYPDSDGKMVKQVGIDPYGGIDPTSANVIWSNTNSNDKAWINMAVAAAAEATTITVFAKVQAPENNSFNHTDLDMVYFEDARINTIGPPPTTNLNAVANGLSVNLNWSGSPASSWSIKGYEVEYKDQAESNWTTLQSKSGTSTSGNFIGQATHSYTIRARTWQTDGSIDLPGLWVEKSVTINEVVAGQVINHAGLGLSGVTVSVSGWATSTVSANGGFYGLASGPGSFDVVANDFNGFVAPPTTTVAVPTNGVGVLTITLRPTGIDQGISNNDFEPDLSGWNRNDNTAATASTNSSHTGQRSLWISKTVNISQTGAVTGMRNPLLSFWYNSDTDFTVQFLGAGLGSGSIQQQAVSPVQTQTLNSVSGWTHVMVELNASKVYTGDIGVNFSYAGASGANIFIDEVSIATGPYKIYLPVAFKN